MNVSYFTGEELFRDAETIHLAEDVRRKFELTPENYSRKHSDWGKLANLVVGKDG